MGNELQIVTEEVLTSEVRNDLNLELDTFIDAHKGNRQEINKLVFKCVAIMEEANDASDELANKKGVERFVGSITGSNKKLQDTINSNRGAVQYTCQQLLQKLAEQSLMTFDLITAVNNKLNASLIKVDGEINKVYEYLIKFFKKNRSELVRLESRLEKAERNINLLTWQNSIEYQEFEDTEYRNLDPISKIVCITRDFYDITKGIWSTSDLLLLKAAMSTIDLEPEDRVNCYDALKVIAEDEVLLEKLFESAKLIEVSEPQYLVSASGIQKIYALGNKENYVVDAVKGYMKANNLDSDEEIIKDIIVSKYLLDNAGVNLNIEIECFDFILELLYNLQGYEYETLKKNSRRESAFLVSDCKLADNVEILKELAENGNARAMYLLSIYFGSINRDDKAGSEWLDKAQKNGDSLAIIKIAADDEKYVKPAVLEQVKNMAEAGYVYAYFELGRYYYYSKKEYDKAIELYTLASDKGSTRASMTLGDIYYHGQNVEVDYARALKWYSKIAEQGSPELQNTLGNMYLNGYGTEVNSAKAVKWYAKAAEQGNAEGQTNLGRMYEEYAEFVGGGCTEAVKWYTKAAEQGYVIAQNILGSMYLNGRGVEKNYEEAINWFTKAIEQGNSDAQCALGSMYLNGQGIKKDYEEAMNWFTKAAEQDNPSAQNYIGFMYENEYYGNKDFVEATKWYAKAARQGYVKGQFNLGRMYEEWGEFVEGDDTEAVKWYTKAAEQGHKDAQYRLGLCYKYGKGVEKSYIEAVKWFTKAAEQGHKDAQYELGICYHNGDGVKQSYEEAVKWLTKAAEQGCRLAQLLLNVV